MSISCHNRLVAKILVVLLAAFSMTPVFAEDETEVRSRPVIIRYDGTQITLSGTMLSRIFNRDKIRKQIGANVAAVEIDSGAPKQPPGVLAISLGFTLDSALDGEEAEEKLFESARRVIAKLLNDRLLSPTISRLYEHREDLAIQIEAAMREADELEKKLVEEFSLTPEIIQKQQEELQLSTLQANINLEGSDFRLQLLQHSVGELKKQKQELEKARSNAMSQVERFAQLGGQIEALEEMKAKYSADHPRIKALSARIAKLSEEFGSEDPKQSLKNSLVRENVELDAEMKRVDQLALVLEEESRQLSISVNVDRHKAEVIERKLVLLNEQAKKVSEFTKLRKIVQRINENAKAKEQVLAEVRRKISQVQSVTVEVW